MAMFDYDGTAHTRLLPDDLGIDIQKIYHIAFFSNGKLDTRPIKLDNIYKVRTQEPKTMVTWTYFFEVEKSAVEKLTDKRLWKRLVGIDDEVVHKNITQGYEIKFREDWEMIDFELIAETPSLAKLKLCMIGNITKEASKEKLDALEVEMEYFREVEPDLLIRAMDWSFSPQDGDITDYADKFLNIEDDIRNR